jgi:hypothetical protein
MRRVLCVAVFLLAAGCGGKKPPPGDSQRLAASDAVKVLRGDDSPYRIIYNPPVDLAKKTGS